MSFLAVALIFPILSSLATPAEKDIHDYNISVVPWSGDVKQLENALFSVGLPAIFENVPIADSIKVISNV